MNKINIEEMKRYLKRSLKKKVKITTSLIVLFMMSSSIVSGHIIVVDKGKIGSGSSNGKNGWGLIQHDPPKGAVALNISSVDENRVAHENVGEYSVAVGYGAEAKAVNSVSIGHGSYSNASDSVSIGHDSNAKGVNSIVIGSVYNGYDIDPANNKPKKNKKGEVIELKNFTTAEGEDSIAIGSGAYVKQSENGGKGIFDSGKQRATESSMAIGTNSRTQVYRSIAIGNNAEAIPIKNFYPDYGKDKSGKDDPGYIQNGAGGEAVAIGSGTKAVDQATSIGNGTYAIGRSSIAIGSDDNKEFTESITKEDYDNYFERLYKVIDEYGLTYGFRNSDKFMYIDKTKYSPTLALGEGGIAIGTRALSYGIGSTSIGAFSFALGKYSTAMGAKTRAEGEGAIAIGNGTKVFSNQSVAVGNENQVLNEGGTAYGYKAYSSGKNSIAIGYDVYTNTILSKEAENNHFNYIGRDNKTVFYDKYMTEGIDAVIDRKKIILQNLRKVRDYFL